MHNYGKMFYRVYIKQCQFSPNIDQDSENQNVKKKKKKNLPDPAGTFDI